MQATTVARLLYVLPALLAVIALALVRAGLDERQTLERGSLYTAEVVDVEIRNRADVTYGHIDLSIPLEDGETLERRLPLPLSLLTPLEGRQQVDVRVLPGSSTDVVIDFIARAQWRMALIHSAMTAVGAILLFIGVLAWNRYLAREGDPAHQSISH
jgi:hypothetical protein